MAKVTVGSVTTLPTLASTGLTLIGCATPSADKARPRRKDSLPVGAMLSSNPYQSRSTRTSIRSSHLTLRGPLRRSLGATTVSGPSLSASAWPSRS